MRMCQVKFMFKSTDWKKKKSISLPKNILNVPVNVMLKKNQNVQILLGERLFKIAVRKALKSSC